MPNVNQIQSPFQINTNMATTQKKANGVADGQTSFKETLFEALNKVNKLQAESSKATELLAKGQIENLHDVMIAGQKASIALSATIEVRNKVIEAYQEIMRMQV